MGKRSDKPRRAGDFYPTPAEAVGPLLPHIEDIIMFEEPCAGDGRLVDALEQYGKICTYSCDLFPRRPDISTFNAFDITTTTAQAFITNPPWTWELLEPMVLHLSDIAPTWVLLNADTMHNVRSSVIGEYCVKVVSVGRVSWMMNGVKGMENAAWFLFDKSFTGETAFYWRGK